MIYEKKTLQDYDLYQLAMDTAIVNNYVSAELLSENHRIERSASEEIIEGFLIDEFITKSEKDGIYNVREDGLFNEARMHALTLDVISISDIQRKLKTTWPRAKRLMFALVREGVVAEGGIDEKRKVLANNIK